VGERLNIAAEIEEHLPAEHLNQIVDAETSGDD
jgi:hypothetical protein